MQITELYKDLELLTQASYRTVRREEGASGQEETVLVEHTLDVYVNERLTMRLTCTPQYLAELVLGRLLTERMITGAGDVELIYICEQGLRARVMLSRAPEPKPDFVEETPSCCTGNRILRGDFILDGDLPPVTPIPVKDEWVFALADTFARGMPMHRRTRGAHSCYLVREGEVLFSCEDLGRHNAIDKAVGYALRREIPPGECMLYTSGRLSADMVRKAAAAGVPVLISKAVPTTAAIALAAQAGLTLIGSSFQERYVRYTPGFEDAE